MATKKEIMRQLLKGVSWNEAARALRCSKATVAKCAAKMAEERIGQERLESMTDAEVSGLFADGRGKRGEEYLGPDYARICDQLARVPKMTPALQWARYCDCNPGGKRLFGGTVKLLFTICANESAPIALTYFHRFRQRLSTVFGYSAPLLSRGRSFSR